MGKAPRAAKPANGGKPPAAAKPVEPDADDAEALLGSLNHSAERLQTLWISFILYCFYVAIAASGTTHRMLLLEEPINLPVVNLPLPLVPFYIVAPITLLVFHFYLLMMLVLLARTAKQFNDALRVAIPDTDARENMRFRMENSLFLQMVAGAERERKGWNGRWLQLVATVTVVAAPIAALMLTQAMFIPYHSSFVTWFHRGVVLADLIAVLCFWPSFHGKGGAAYWPERNWRLVYIVPVCLAVSVFSWIVLTFPGEWAHEKAREFAVLEENVTHCDWRGYMPPNCLSLVGQDFVNEEELDKLRKGNVLLGGKERWQAMVDLRGRDLSYADFSSTDFRHSDFSGRSTNLMGSTFYSAWLEDSHFDFAHLEGANFARAQMSRTSFVFSSLQGSSFNGATMAESVLRLARLDAASLRSADLTASHLSGAAIVGTDLTAARLDGAIASSLTFHAATLSRASLLGANLSSTYIVGTDLTYALLDGSNMVGAKILNSDLTLATVFRVRNPGRVARSVGSNDLRRERALRAFNQNERFDLSDDADFRRFVWSGIAKLKGNKNKEDFEEIFAPLSPSNHAFDDARQKLTKSDKNRKSALQFYAEERLSGLKFAACKAKSSKTLLNFLIGSPLISDSGRESSIRVDERRVLVNFLKNQQERDHDFCPGAQYLTSSLISRLE